MELITAEQIKSAQDFFEQACQKHSCIFAIGYLGSGLGGGELPICSRRRSHSSDGRETLLPASERWYCEVGAIQSEEVGGKSNLIVPVTISPDGVKIGKNMVV